MPELRPYQQEDVDFLKTLDAAACFNQQRTGKTPTALMLVKEKQLTKILIVAPSSALMQWAEEYTRWLDSPCIALIGTPKKKQKLLAQWTDGLVISYDTLKITQRTEGLINEIKKHKPEMIIVDEAHRIKSRSSARTHAIQSFRQMKHKLVLTATPSHGKPEEIFPILQFLYPKLFSSYWNFIGYYFKERTHYLPTGLSYKAIIGFQKGKDIELQEYLATISTQRKRKDVMPWLPEKDISQIKLPPTKQQTKYLQELTDFWETEHIITQGTLDRLVRYRQICLDPGLLELKGASPKTEWILQYLKDYPDESIIIFSKFTSYLKQLDELLRKHKEKVNLMIGATPIAKRNKIKNDFQKGAFRVLLLNLDVGKEALTLDQASTIIFTDKYPPIGDIEQAEDRFIATSEERADKPHKIYELMIKDTYDESLYTLLAMRKTETDVLNDYKHFIEERRRK